MDSLLGSIAGVTVAPVGLPVRGMFGLVAEDRRHGVSVVERASWTLAHAAEYLMEAHVGGHGVDGAGEAAREAIALLCVAGERVRMRERRVEARRDMASWLRGAARARAEMAQECW